MTMIKKIFKTLSIILLLLILVIFYLSFVGIKTNKFNDKINNKILEINKGVNLDIDNIKFLLNPYNFTVDMMTMNPKIYIEENQLELKSIKINISLKALLEDQFSINDLKVETREIKINDVILLAKSFRNSTELFLLNRFTKSGSLTANIKLNFDKVGKIKEDYQINGLIKKGEFNFLNRFDVKNLNFEFDIDKNKYSLTKIKAILNDIDLSSSLIEVIEKKDLFLVKGNVTTNENNFDIKQLNILFGSFLKNLNVEKIKFGSVNDFS